MHFYCLNKLSILVLNTSVEKLHLTKYCAFFDMDTICFSEVFKIFLKTSFSLPMKTLFLVKGS